MPGPLVRAAGPQSATPASCCSDELMQVDDPQELVAFLCRKFTGLIDKVQAAEDQASESRQQAAAVEEQLRHAAEQRRSICAGLQVAAGVGQNGAKNTRRHLNDVQARSSTISAELRRVRQGMSSMEEQCEAMSARCHEEQRCAVDVEDSVAQANEARVCCEQERARLRGDVSLVMSRLASAEQELHASREAEQRHRSAVRMMEDRILETRRARQAAEQKGEALRSDVCGALRKAALFRERLEAAHHTLLRRQDELNGEDEQLAALRAENQERGRQAVALERNLEQLQDAKASLEGALRENVDAHNQLLVVQKMLATRREESSMHECKLC